jgi:hypothetical protein
MMNYAPDGAWAALYDEGTVPLQRGAYPYTAIQRLAERFEVSPHQQLQDIALFLWAVARPVQEAAEAAAEAEETPTDMEDISIEMAPLPEPGGARIEDGPETSSDEEHGLDEAWRDALDDPKR